MQTSLVTKMELKNSEVKNTLKWVSRNCHTEERERKKKKQKEREGKEEKRMKSKREKKRKKEQKTWHIPHSTHTESVTVNCRSQYERKND